MKFRVAARFAVAGGLLIATLGMLGVQNSKLPTHALPTTLLAAPAGSLPFLKMAKNKINYGFYTSAGKWQSTESDQGKIVLLFFWATWCKPSEEILDSLDWLWQQYQQSSVVIVTIALDSELESIAAFLQEKKLNVPYTSLSQEIITASGMVAGVPTLYYLSPQGIVYKKREGLFSREQLDNDVRQMLANP